MIFSPQLPVAQTSKAPNPALGLVFTVVLAGAGFTYIDLPIWHLVWYLVMTFGTVGAMLLVGLTGNPFLIIVPALLFVGMLVHYVVAYGQRYGRGQQPAGISESLKWGLIGGQVALGLILNLGVLPAIVLPNLLSARGRATDARYMIYVRQIQTTVAAEITGTEKPFNGPCSTLKEPVPTTGLDIASCTIAASSTSDMKVTVVNRAGKTYTSH